MDSTSAPWCMAKTTGRRRLGKWALSLQWAICTTSIRSRWPDRSTVTLKIETISDGHCTTIRLIGRMQAEHLDELKAQIGDSKSEVVLDLDEVNLVDVQIVRFLATCEERGVRLSTAPPIYATGLAKSEINKIGETMSKKLEGKIALITGGSRGIGAAIAKRLAVEGANVAITYTKGADAATAVVKEIERGGRKAIAIQADATNAGAVGAAVEKTVATFGGLDVLVNNAGTAIPKKFEEATLEELDRLIDLNIRGTFIATQAALKQMKNGGRIITMGSCVGERNMTPGLAAYAATKGAVKMFAQSLSREVGSRGITVNNIQPGPIDTDLNPAAGEWAVPQKANTALNRYGSVDEVAALVAFVAGPEAAYITGASLTVDGGTNA